MRDLPLRHHPGLRRVRLLRAGSRLRRRAREADRPGVARAGSRWSASGRDPGPELDPLRRRGGVRPLRRTGGHRRRHGPRVPPAAHALAGQGRRVGAGRGGQEPPAPGQRAVGGRIVAGGGEGRRRSSTDRAAALLPAAQPPGQPAPPASIRRRRAHGRRRGHRAPHLRPDLEGAGRDRRIDGQLTRAGRSEHESPGHRSRDLSPALHEGPRRLVDTGGHVRRPGRARPLDCSPRPPDHACDRLLLDGCVQPGSAADPPHDRRRAPHRLRRHLGPRAVGRTPQGHG